jgi:hypothetical protein
VFDVRYFTKDPFEFSGVQILMIQILNGSCITLSQHATEGFDVVGSKPVHLEIELQSRVVEELAFLSDLGEG